MVKQNNNSTEVENEDTEVISLWTETKTRLIYEAKFFGDFVIVRPLSPGLAGLIKKLTYTELARDFTEYSGDYSVVKAYIDGDYEPQEGFL